MDLVSDDLGGVELAKCGLEGLWVLEGGTVHLEETLSNVESVVNLADDDLEEGVETLLKVESVVNLANDDLEECCFDGRMNAEKMRKGCCCRRRVRVDCEGVV